MKRRSPKHDPENRGLDSGLFKTTESAKAADPVGVDSVGHVEEAVMATQAVVVEQEPQKEAAKHLAKYESGALQLNSLADMMAWAEAVIRSGFAPRGFIKASQVIVATQTGRELGLGPAAALRSIYVTPSGRPGLYAEVAHALCVRAGLEGWRHEFSGEGDERKCTYHVKRKGQWSTPSTFSMAEAKKAGLVKSGSGWEKWPDRMLLARAKAFAYHDSFPDAILGLAVQGDGVDELPPEEKPVLTAEEPPPSEPDPLLEAD